ncbi:hypothetical protein, partial [Sphaerotilus montanus]|uniref:hypothetical protein n=1 Tax=Sphaerotilus montanus TaxID=522889 RepID=UPI003FA27693
DALRNAGKGAFIEGTAGVDDGILGVWRVADLPPGQYTLRLRVTTLEGIPVETKLVVQIAR